MKTKLKHIAKEVNIRIMPTKLHFAPEWIVLGVNNICNMKCKMCDVGVGYENSNFYHNLMGAKPLNMPRELIFKILDQVSSYFPNSKIGYAFTEPIIYPHLIESLDYANQKNLYTSITTNASKLEKLAEEFVRVNLNDVFVSLDGPPEIHNEIRGSRLSFERALKGIEKLLSLTNDSSVSVYCTITEWNIGHLLEFIKYFKNIPLKEMGFMHTNYTPQSVADTHNSIYGNIYPATASNMELINLEKMDLDLLWEEIKEINSVDWPFKISFSPNINSKNSLKEFYHNPEKIVGKRCNDVFRTIMIKSDGTAIPSHGRCYSVTVGNIYEQNLAEIWNSDILAKFRKDLLAAGGLLPACSRCCSAF